MTTVRLQVNSDAVPEPVLQDITRSLRDDIERHTGATAEIPVEPQAGHHKGEALTLGVLAVSFLSSGAAAAFCNLLKAYVERDRSVTITIDQPGGMRTTLTASNLDQAEAIAEKLRAGLQG